MELRVPPTPSWPHFSEYLSATTLFPNKVTFFLKLFTSGCTGSLLLLTGFLWLQWAGSPLQLRCTDFHCSGFPCCAAQALERWLSRWGTWALLLQDMYGLPRSGIEPASPALSGGFLTTESQGKSLRSHAEVRGVKMQPIFSWNSIQLVRPTLQVTPFCPPQCISCMSYPSQP